MFVIGVFLKAIENCIMNRLSRNISSILFVLITRATTYIFSGFRYTKMFVSNFPYTEIILCCNLQCTSLSNYKHLSFVVVMRPTSFPVYSFIHSFIPWFTRTSHSLLQARRTLPRFTSTRDGGEPPGATPPNYRTSSHSH